MANATSTVIFSRLLPAPPANTINVAWQTDGGTPVQLISANVPILVGDSGSGGAVGLVPAPPAGSAALGKFLRADGIFAIPAGSGGGITPVTSPTVYVNGIEVAQGTSAAGPIGLVIDGGGAVPATGFKGILQVPFSCTINGWTLLADQSGSAQITVSKGTYAAFPTVSSIVASAPPALSGTQKATSTTLTGWTIAITAGDVLSFNLDSVATCTWIILELQITRS